MDDDVKVLERIYDRFNARDIDGVLTALTDDVAWANGMDGGHVHGREAVREYWTRQWTMVSPHVEPVGFRRTQDGAIIAEVRQSVRDLEGKPLEGQTHGLEGQDGRTRFPSSRGQGGSLRHPGCRLVRLDSIWMRVGSTFDTNLHLIASSISLARWRRGDLLAWRRSRVQSPRLGGPHGVGMEFPRVAGQLFGVRETDALVCRGCGHRAPRPRSGDEAARP